MSLADDFEITPAIREYLRRFEASLRADENHLATAMAARREALEHLLGDVWWLADV